MDTMRSERKVAIAAWLLLSFAAAGQDGVHAYDIPAQPLEQAVEALQRHQWVVRDAQVTWPAGRSSRALRQPAAAARPARRCCRTPASRPR